MLQSPVVNALGGLFLTPIGPPVILLVGAAVVLIVGRWLRRTDWLAGVALVFVGAAAVCYISLQYLSIVPTFSHPWQPLFQDATNLFWISDGWNYYLGALILLTGGLGVLLNRSHRPDGRALPHSSTVLALNLAVVAAALLFVNSGNLLTVLLVWVFLDLAIVLRGAVDPVGLDAAQTGGAAGVRVQANEARVLSLLGAMLLLIGILPAGFTGLAQELAVGNLPAETLLFMLMAAAIRSGVYPFHLWVLPRGRTEVNVAERFLDQIVPVLAGLWLMGWVLRLGGAELLQGPLALAIFLLAILASAVAAWTTAEQPQHVAFVLITSSSLAVLAGTLSATPGPAGLVWALTAFALGGGLWLVGEQAWRAWGWQIPVSVGALALAGTPFTPGFMALPSFASLLSRGPLYWPVFGLYVLAQGTFIAALLRSWSTERTEQGTAKTGQVYARSYMVRLLLATLALGLPLAVTGFLPVFAETLIAIPNAIPAGLGALPTGTAGLDVWLTLILPYLLGFGLIWLRPRLWPRLGAWPDRLSQFSQLEWLFRSGMWIVDQGAQLGHNALHVVEGAGYLGWFLALVLAGILLLR
jgi:hypothetical protein